MSSDETDEPKEIVSAYTDNQVTPLREGRDYYLENGFLVFTAYYLTKRGYCCENGCRHCPYGVSKE